MPDNADLPQPLILTTPVTLLVGVRVSDDQVAKRTGKLINTGRYFQEDVPFAFGETTARRVGPPPRDDYHDKHQVLWKLERLVEAFGDLAGVTKDELKYFRSTWNTNFDHDYETWVERGRPVGSTSDEEE